MEDREEERNKKKIELAFPKYEEEDSNGEYISKGKGEGLVKHLSTSIDDIADWFKQYQVESIELWKPFFPITFLREILYYIKKCVARL